VRSASSDGAGNYSIVDLRPGAYDVTFTLPGFSVIKREGIILQGSFNAQVNAELKVGALEETVVVSGASPVVDVKNTQSQAVLSTEQLNALPGSRSLKGRAALVAGVVVPSANTGVVVHGSDSNDSHSMVDGFKAGNHLVGRGTGQLGIGSSSHSQEAAIQEIVYDTGAQGAEYALSGVRMNAIPKEGGNRFVTEGIAYGYHKRFASDNIPDNLRAVGFRVAPQIFSYDFNPVLGGPIVQDKLWFFASLTGNNQNSYVLDTYFKEGHPSTPAGKGGQLADTGSNLNLGETIRITHQVTSRNKLRYSFDNLKTVTPRGSFGQGTQPEAAWFLTLSPTYLGQIKYTAPLTSRILVEAGFAYQRGDFVVDFQPNNPATAITRWDQGTGIISENHILRYGNQERKKEAKVSMAYVTGSHSFKTGFENRWATADQANPFNSDINYRTLINGVPNSVAVTNGPARNVMELRFDGGAFVQDQWRVGRFTINMGGRWDRFNAGVPAQSAPQGYFVPAVNLAEISNTPAWNDWALRFGGAYDVFGNGKTAIKAFVGKYVAGHALSRTSQFNPLFAQTDVRSWTDLDGNDTVVNPDGTPQFNEIGPPRNLNFGTLVGTSRLDPNLPRDKNMSYEVSVQHELFPRVSVNTSYYRRHYYDLAYTDNLATSASDWVPFTITGPRDARLPNGGGDQITLYNLNPAKLGLVDNILTSAEGDFRTYNGLEFSANFELPRNGFMLASWTLGKIESRDCRMENPNGSTATLGIDQCHTTSPFRHIVKISGGFPLPFNTMVSGNFQIYDTPGSGIALVPPYIRSNYAVSSAIAGRAITGGGSLNYNLVQPNTIWNDYYKIVDVRISKHMTLGRLRTTLLMEFDNLLNMSNVVTVQQTFGANWLRPTTIQAGRRIRFGTQWKF
jgi:hypothetical protein